MKSNLQIVIEHLTIGRTLPFSNGFNLTIHEDNLYFVSNENDEYLYPCDLTFNDFVKFCNKFTRDEIFLIGAETAMRKMGQERSRKREKREN